LEKKFDILGNPFYWRNWDFFPKKLGKTRTFRKKSVTRYILFQVSSPRSGQISFHFQFNSHLDFFCLKFFFQFFIKNNNNNKKKLKKRQNFDHLELYRHFVFLMIDQSKKKIRKNYIFGGLKKIYNVFIFNLSAILNFLLGNIYYFLFTHERAGHIGNATFVAVVFATLHLQNVKMSFKSRSVAF
jgi:hypothetical protein